MPLTVGETQILCVHGVHQYNSGLLNGGATLPLLFSSIQGSKASSFCSLRLDGHNRSARSRQSQSRQHVYTHIELTRVGLKIQCAYV